MTDIHDFQPKNSNHKGPGDCGPSRAQEGQSGIGEHRAPRISTKDVTLSLKEDAGHALGGVNQPELALKDLLFLTFLSITKQNFSHPQGPRNIPLLTAEHISAAEPGALKSQRKWGPRAIIRQVLLGAVYDLKIQKWMGDF